MEEYSLLRKKKKKNVQIFNGIFKEIEMLWFGCIITRVLGLTGCSELIRGVERAAAMGCRGICCSEVGIVDIVDKIPQEKLDITLFVNL